MVEAPKANSTEENSIHKAPALTRKGLAPQYISDELGVMLAARRLLNWRRCSLMKMSSKYKKNKSYHSKINPTLCSMGHAHNSLFCMPSSPQLCLLLFIFFCFLLSFPTPFPNILLLFLFSFLPIADLRAYYP
ncbi:hypothetical protein DVH24_035396 [Malus domestica]|uniref:Uncharacterized protein n=1 Tax=Malus domestica TaxID=3750 RepID=A0A498JA03_MALDO|nr:hypothetical protein DVH24_035396 [Malus domestica]